MEIEMYDVLIIGSGQQMGAAVYAVRADFGGSSRQKPGERRAGAEHL